MTADLRSSFIQDKSSLGPGEVVWARHLDLQVCLLQLALQVQYFCLAHRQSIPVQLQVGSHRILPGPLPCCLRTRLLRLFCRPGQLSLQEPVAHARCWLCVTFHGI